MSEELFTGWAPDAPIDDSLLRQFVFALADRGSFLASRTGGRELRTDDVGAVDLASPVLFDNAAVLLRPPTMFDLDEVVAQCAAFYPPERPFVLMSAWHLPDLSSHGLSLMGYPPFMVRPAGGDAPPLPDGLRIEEVTDGAAAATFVRTIVEAYPMPGADEGTPFDERILGGIVRLFIGYVDDRPVATAGTCVHHGVNDVEWISLMPDCRGRGYGEAMTWAATLADPSLPAVLIASDDGQPVYERMGYLRLQRLTLWYRMPD